MDKVKEEHDKLASLYKEQGADDLKLKIYDNLIVECARAKVQLDELNEIAEKTGLVKVHPEFSDMQKPLPVATEISKVRASITNIMFKLDRILCVNMEEEWDDLGDFE